MKKRILFIWFFTVSFSPFTYSQTWLPVGNGITGNGPDGIFIRRLVVYQGSFYAGGSFSTAGIVHANNIARWNGSAWDSVGSGIKAWSGGGAASCVVNDSILYVSGQFYEAGHDSARGVAQWNGTSWDSVGSGITPKQGENVEDLAFYNNELYAGGGFTKASGAVINANNIARWNGIKWDSVGSGTDEQVDYLMTYNGKLYVSGGFTHAGGIHANYIATWDDTSWDSVGSGLNGCVLSLAVYNGELYAGGDFTHAGGIHANDIARWDGTKWDSVGSGTSHYAGAFVGDMKVFNGYLYVSGDFDSAGGKHASYVARWDGTNWDSVGIGLSSSSMFGGNVAVLAVYDSTLYAGGEFTNSGSTVLNNIAMFCDTCPPLGVAQQKTKNEEVGIEPNPNNGVFTLTLPSPSGEGVSFVEIYNMMGEQVASELHSKGWDKIQVNLSKEPNGIYLYRVVSENGKLIGDGKFVIER